MAAFYDPETFSHDQLVLDALDRAAARERETEPELDEIEDWEVPDTRTLRARIADGMESVGVAIAERYWSVVRRVRGTA